MRSEPISVVLWASAVSIPVIFNLRLCLLSRRIIQIPNGLWNGGIFFIFVPFRIVRGLYGRGL